MKTSISKIQTFLRCRRKWDIESPNRQNLALKQAMPNEPFYIGNMVHRFLELKAKRTSMPFIDLALGHLRSQAEQNYRNIVGCGWSTVEQEEIESYEELVYSIMANYFDHYGDEHPLGADYEYLQAELTFQVRIPRTRNYLIGTIDGVAIHKPSGNIWLVEHKTFGQNPAKLEDLRMNYQMLAYSWAARSLLGYSTEGVIYDGIAKKIPGTPELLKNEKGLSKTWIITTASIYRAEIAKYGFDMADYTEILERLEAQDRSENNRFFVRYKIRYSEAELDQFESELVLITREMASKHIKIYPTSPWSGCSGVSNCSFRDLCTAIQTCADTTWLLQDKYQKNPGWKTTQTKPIRSLVIEE